ncbi:MAG: PD-(D/E)XK nuclease family protein [Pseudomonadota bacterium]
MRALVGQEFGGTTLTALDDLERGRGVIGDVVWGPKQLLRDLELRLGLGTGAEPEALRVARLAARMATSAPLGRFYSRSFELDALGTAATLLRLRDSLIDAEWNGHAILGGGRRLDAIVELESMSDPVLPAGTADRLAAVHEALARCRVCIYTELILAEPVDLWSRRWQAVFRGLERAGTHLSYDGTSLRGAPADSDLGQVQAALNGEARPKPIALTGDGSFVVLSAETSWEAASATAAILATLGRKRAVVIRGGDTSALDNALAVHGLATQGWRSSSPWRAALQVLPLALELAFEPKDPYRVLELLTLPIGPFLGLAGRHLARALAKSPGIGSPLWEGTKIELAKVVDSYATRGSSAGHGNDEHDRGDRLQQRIAEWFEQPGADAVTGATKADLQAVVERVRAWLISRLPGAPDDATLLAAVGHTSALRAALDSDPRSILNLVEVQRLAESILASGTRVELIEERAGRIDHVDSPGGLGVSREVIVWWHFANGSPSVAGLPWRRQELAALSAAGIRFPEPRARLENQAASWRRAVLAATRQLILVVPATSAGTTLGHHPLWDEIVARARLDGRAQAQICVSTRELLSSSPRDLLERPPREPLKALALPGGQQEWVVPAEHMLPIDHFSSSSLNSLLGCPLQWALQYRARLNAGGHSLPPLHMLSGTLGHRLVEVLHGQGAFNLADARLKECAEREVDALFVREGSILLRAGMAFERSQLRSQLVHSVIVLAGALRAAELHIVAVEKPLEAEWRGVKLTGSIDLLVATKAGVHAIIDMKWGLVNYRELLERGEALQLAVYAFATATERGEQHLPEAGYFSLKQGKLFGLATPLWPHAEQIVGPTLGETWKRIDATVDRADQHVMKGRFPVTGVRRSVPLLSSIGVPENAHAGHLTLTPEASCTYCNFDAVCGRRWERQA